MGIDAIDIERINNDFRFVRFVWEEYEQHGLTLKIKSLLNNSMVHI